jgi:hypothetical protein
MRAGRQQKLQFSSIARVMPFKDLQGFYRKPVATKSYPSSRQRHVLQILLRGEWMPLSKLTGVRETILGHLIDRG